MAQQLKKKFIGNDQIDSTKIKLLQDQSIRGTDSNGSEVDLVKLGSSDEVLVKGVEVSLKSDLQSEESARISGDANLQSQIDNIISNVDPAALDSLTEIVEAFQQADSDLNAAISALGTGSQSALAQEILDREAADTDLQNQIDAEEASRISADQGLQSSIDVVSGDLSQEISDRQTLEGEFDAYVVSNDAALAQEISDRIADVSDEESRALAAEGVLQSNIDSEQSRAEGVEASLQSQITQEISDRDSAVSNLQSQIGTLSSDLSQEITDRTSNFQLLDDNKLEKGGGTITGMLTIDLGEGSSVTEISGSGVKVSFPMDDSGAENEISNVGSWIHGLVGDLESEATYSLSGAYVSYYDENGDMQPKMPESPEELTTKAYVDQEISALSSGGVAQVAADLAQEVQDRIDGDSNLQSQIDTEKGRIDAILDASQADKDSFAEIVSLINSVDTENDTAFAGYVLSNDAALAQEVSDRQSGDNTLQSNIDTVSSNLSQEVSDRQTLEGEFDAYVVSNDAALAQEVSDRTSADSNLQSQIDQVVSDLAQEVLDRASDVDTEEQRALAAEQTLQDNIDAEESSRIAAVQSLQDQIDALDTGFVTEAELASTVSSLQSEIDSDVAAEAALRDAADVVLQQNIDFVSSTLSQEMLDRISADEDLYLQVSTNQEFIENLEANLEQEVIDRGDADSVLQGNIDSEESARIAADDALDVRVSVLESVVFFKEKFVLTATDISNEFVTLSHSPESNSMSAFVDRLAIHEGAGEDYSISGSTMTFLNDMIGTGNQKLQAGDTIYVKYQYKM